MTVTRRGYGYALNGDIHELTEALNLLEYYIEDDAKWSHNRRRRPAMLAQAARYKQLRERLGALSGEEAGSETVVISETIITNADTDQILPFVQCAYDGCERQIDNPRNRLYCAFCEDNYCLQHANPKAHDCPSSLA